MALPFADEVDEIFGDGLGLVLFKKQREEKTEHSAAGSAVVFKLRDRVKLEEFIGEIADAADQPFEKHESDDITFWVLTKTRFLDDPVNTQPAFAVIGDYFIISNWRRLFTDTQDVIDRNQPPMPARNQLDESLQELSQGARAFLFVDVPGLYDHMDQAKEGWIAARAEIDPFEQRDLRRGLHARWRQEKPPRPEDDWVDEQFQRAMARLRAKRDPARIRRDVDGNLDYFRGAYFPTFSLFWGNTMLSFGSI